MKTKIIIKNIILYLFMTFFTAFVFAFSDDYFDVNVPMYIKRALSVLIVCYVIIKVDIELDNYNSLNKHK